MGRSDESSTSAWQKTTTDPAKEQPSWQEEGAGKSGWIRGSLHAARRQIGVGLLLPLFLALTTVLVYYLVLLPTRTRVITGVAVGYSWPLPPNSWAQEDVETLKDHLDGQTLSIDDIPLSMTSATEGLAALADQLRQPSKGAARGETVVVYLSAHGAVDGQRRPCLLLPSSDPLDSNTWLRVADLLEQFRSIGPPSGGHYLLILDGNRQLANWSAGSLQNGFADRLTETVAAADVPGLAVLNSTSPGQTGWTSFSLRGSVFGHFVNLGLAGAADSDRDRRVSLHELHAYLRESVDGWVSRHRADRQVPLLIPDNAPNFPISWSLNQKDLRRLVEQSGTPTDSAKNSAAARLAQLWQKHEHIESLAPHHYAPATWSAVEHDLLWLEQAALAGKAYHDSFERVSARLERKFTHVLESLGTQGNGTEAAVAPVQIATALASEQTLPVEQFDVYSLALAEYLGTAKLSDQGKSSDVHLKTLLDRYGVEKLWESDVARRVIELHRIGENQAVPGRSGAYASDLRAHALVRPLLDVCDVARRIVEDRAYLGPRADQEILARKELGEEIEQLQRQYVSIAEMEATLAAAYQTRDRAWIEMPYLAQMVEHWQDGPTGAASTEDEAYRPANRSDLPEILALVAKTNRLDKVLRQAIPSVSKVSPDQAGAPELFSTGGDLAREIELSLVTFHARLLNEARRLATAPATAETLQEMETILAAPLVTGRTRSELYAHYVKILEEVDNAPAHDRVVSDRKSIAAQRPAGHTEPSLAFRTISAMLSRERLSIDAPQDASTTGGDLDASLFGEAGLLLLEQQLRETLRSGKHPLPESTSFGREPLSPQEEPRGTSARLLSDLLEEDGRLRRWIALRHAAQPNPFRRLRLAHLQDLLIWHGQRKLDDFWGAMQADNEAYFAEATESYSAAVQLLGRLDLQRERELDRLLARCEDRREAARKGMTTTSSDMLLIDDQFDVTTQVGVHATPQSLALPSGIAAVFLRSGNKRVQPTTHPLRLQSWMADGRDALQKIDIAFQGQELPDVKGPLQAVAMFRGHEFAAPLMLREMEGARVEVERHRYGTSQITLRGPQLRQAQIVFILDCSNSMKDSVSLEGPELSEQRVHPTKLQVAVDALRGMLERIGERGNCQIGVRFFGHRVGWRTDQSGTLARREDYPDGIPPTLQPYADVELYLPLGRFDSVTAGVVGQRLETLKPWGESPLYVALEEALRDFPAADPHAEQRVVVITDGANYQFNPPPEYAISRSAIEEAYSNRGVSIDLIGFAVPEEEQSITTREFDELAWRTGGKSEIATNASSLIRTLEQLLKETEFLVVDDSGTILSKAELGSTAKVAHKDAEPRSYAIEVGELRATATLDGGEALQLAVNLDEQRIMATPYERGNPVFAALVTPAPTKPSGYRVGVHRAIRDDMAVAFPISLQRDDMGIPARLGEIWVEVLPLLPAGEAPATPYVFFDRNYEPELPVPVLRCCCANWPAKARRAEIRVWCLPQAIAPAEVVPIGQVADKAPTEGRGFELDNLSDVRYQVRTVRDPQTESISQVRVVQWHEAGRDVNALKLELFPPPDRIVHQFDATRGIVLHTFDYVPEVGDPGILPEIRFQPRTRLIDRAWRLEQPVTVSIAEHSEVVSPPRLIAPNARPAETTQPLR